jgi:hypothetical protein
MTTRNLALSKKVGIEFEFKRTLIEYLQTVIANSLVVSYNVAGNTPALRTKAITNLGYLTAAMGFEYKSQAYRALKLIDDAILANGSVLTDDKNAITALVSLVSRYVGMEGDGDFHFDVAVYKLSEAISKALNIYGNPICDYPPYSCSVSVNTGCVEDFTDAWHDCTSLTTFPVKDVSQGRIFKSAWEGCTGLTAFPVLNFTLGVNFDSAWRGNTGLTTFPVQRFPAAKIFDNTWRGCTGLVSFPSIDFSSASSFDFTWSGCTSLTTFPAGMFNTSTVTNFSTAWGSCPLTQASVDNILVSLDYAGRLGGSVTLTGTSMAAPGTAGLAAKASLVAKGWSVTTK